jgi:hypothetical protein
MEYAKANKRSWLRDEQLLKPWKASFRAERYLADITPPEIEGYKLHRRKQMSGATVNRELALLKHMFNLAINWDLHIGSNSLSKGEILSGGKYRLSSLESGGRNQASAECHTRDSGHYSLCSEYGKPYRRYFLRALPARGLG